MRINGLKWTAQSLRRTHETIGLRSLVFCSAFAAPPLNPAFGRHRVDGRRTLDVSWN